MTYPSFTTGEVLTAADMNSVGLWKITTGITVSSVGGTAATVSNGTVTIGTANTSVTVSGAFSSDFDNYKIIINGGTASGADAVAIRLGSTNTGYYFGMNRASYDTGTANTLNDNNQVYWRYACIANTDTLSADVDLFDPFNAKPTRIHAWWIDARAGAFSSGAGAGYLAGTTSYTAFSLIPITGGTTLTGSTIRVYGYRK